MYILKLKKFTWYDERFLDDLFDEGNHFPLFLAEVL